VVLWYIYPISVCFGKLCHEKSGNLAFGSPQLLWHSIQFFFNYVFARKNFKCFFKQLQVCGCAHQFYVSAHFEACETCM
jgi:hypothetical protein